MKKTIYFWGGRHPIQETIPYAIPKEYQLYSNLSQKIFSRTEEYSFFYSRFKRIATIGYETLKLPRVLPIRGKYDLVYTWSGIIPYTRSPWMVQLEYASSFVHLNDRLLRHPIHYNRVMKSLCSNKCKFILPYSNACKIAFENAYPEFAKEYSEKIRVLYPAVKPFRGLIRKKENKIRILFVDRHFFDNGGRELVSAFNKIKSDFLNIELYLITSAPPHHSGLFKKMLQENKNEKRIHFIPPCLTRKQLFHHYYSTSDIFVIPSYIHFFGYSVLEAMSAGLPIIATDTFALPEIVKDGFNGFVIRTPVKFHNSKFLRNLDKKKRKERIIKGEITPVTFQLKEKLIQLIEDENLRNNMGKNSMFLTKKDKFSIKKQKEDLARIIDDAI